MEITDRKKLEQLETDLRKWADRYAQARLKYSKAKTELGLILATEDVKESLSFENKIIALIKLKPELKSLWSDYINGYNKYKSAYLIWQTCEHKINNLKFINRTIL